MNNRTIVPMLASVALLALGAGAAVQAQQATMTFFLTSAGPGKGADLGGLEGADRLCQQLAQAGGAGGKTWRAYLSTQASGGAQAVNARDRIGTGPWKNAKGETIAQNVDDLHSANNKISKQTALTEKGEMVNGRTETPNRHDVLTGSQPDGRAFPPVKIERAATGPRAARARQWSGTMTGRGCATMTRRSPGIRRIRHAVRMGAAARPI